MKSIRRWVYIINVLRALSYVDIDHECIDVNDVKCIVVYDEDMNCHILNNLTQEVLVTFDENGYPTRISDWANAPMVWDEFDYPMYEKEV